MNKYRVTLIPVTGHWEHETETQSALFGVVPDNYDGDGEDLPYDSDVLFWLAPNEPLTVGETYGDFVVTEVNG